MSEIASHRQSEGAPPAVASRGAADPLDLTAEDRKLVILARSARARTRAAQGAALRDPDGRTYAASTVRLGPRELSAIELVVAMALSSGATGAEAVAVLGDPCSPTPDDLAVIAQLGGAGTPVIEADQRGTVLRRTDTPGA